MRLTPSADQSQVRGLASTALVSAVVKGGALSRGSVGGLAHLDGAALDHARAQWW
jgi:hypothetical protein